MLLWPKNDIHCDQVYLKVSMSIKRAPFAPRGEAIIGQTNGGARPACFWCSTAAWSWPAGEESQKPKILATGLDLAGLSQGMVWILSGALPPRLYKDYLFKEGNKTGRHAKLRSMHQLSPVWKDYCWKLKSVFLCSWAVLWDRVWRRQMEAEGLETGYADRGRRFVRFLHPAVDIIAIQEKKRQ